MMNAKEFVKKLDKWKSEEPLPPEIWTSGGGSVPLAHIDEKGCLIIKDNRLGAADALKLAEFIQAVYGQR